MIWDTSLDTPRQHNKRAVIGGPHESIILQMVVSDTQMPKQENMQSFCRKEEFLYQLVCEVFVAYD